MKVLTLFIFLICFASTVSAFLGIFEQGDTVTYSIVCTEDGGKRDSGCTAPGVAVFSPSDSVGLNGSLSEISDNQVPGLWRGNWTIGTTNESGVWHIFINLTNSNGTPAATVINFQVVKNNYGIENLVSTVNTSIISNITKGILAVDANTVTTLDNQAVINANLRSMNLTILANISNTQIGITRNLSNDYGFFSPLLSIFNASLIANLSANLKNLESRNDTQSILSTINASNASILSNISRSSLVSSVSGPDQIQIGLECARQVHRQNLTISFGYNFTNESLNLLNTYYNFTSLNIFINESYGYNNRSMLNRTTKNTSNG